MLSNFHWNSSKLGTPPCILEDCFCSIGVNTSIIWLKETLVWIMQKEWIIMKNTYNLHFHFQFKNHIEHLPDNICNNANQCTDKRVLNSQSFSRLYLFIKVARFIIWSRLLFLLLIHDLIDLVKFIVQFLIFVLLSGLPAVLHLYSKLECSLWHCFLLFIIFGPIFFSLKIPPMQPTFRLCPRQNRKEVVAKH